VRRGKEVQGGEVWLTGPYYYYYYYYYYCYYDIATG